MSDSTQRRRVLLLSYRFPTINSAMVASRRTEALYRYLPEFGWDPTVITVSGKSGADNIVGVEDRSTVGRAERGRRVGGSPVGSRAGFIGRSVGTARMTLKYALRLHPRWFDGYAAWSMDAGRAAEQLGSTTQYDAVWATLSPFSLAWPAVSAARRLELPCVLDLRDPVEEDFPGPRPWLTRALRQAAEVTVAAPMCATPYLRANAVHPSQLILSGTWHTEPQVPEPSSQFRLAFVGTWHHQFDAAPLFQALAELADELPGFREAARAVFIGRGNAYLRSTPNFAAVEPLLELHEMVPYEQAQAETRRASVLLLFRASRFKATAISGKIFDYAAHELPLLSIGGQPGLHGELVEWLGGSLWTNGAQAIAGFVRREFERWRASGTTRVQRNPEALEYLSQRRAAAEMAEVLNAAVEQRAVRVRPAAPWGREALL